MDLRSYFTFDWDSYQHIAITAAIAIAILIVFYLVANLLQRLLRKRLMRRMDDPLLANFLSVIFRLLILLIGFMVVFRVVGLTGVVSGLLAGAGITAFVIGFALKDIGENFLAGILLAFKRPFRVGDVVDINGISGKVVTLNLRDTQIKTADGKDVFIPNANIIKNALVNFTIDGYLRYDFVIGLDYGSDYQGAMDLIIQEVSQVKGVLSEVKQPNIWIADLAESTLNLRVTFWVDTFNPTVSDLKVKSQVIIRVLQALEKAGYNLPSRILELKNHQNLPLSIQNPL
ncbi:Mechanosensitive ion channel [Algoriphagus faecimaris]|uniref:Mechanosensitive ion channel n=1 Tax=Algoriphagus faecimaris TaxID=686796 RepID=A0A1G6TJ82_9BACT|nr:mechanosensitive ion channel family protein [Algoriphagus faecimaris]SDD28477.1 Mechanosensitive ion channel [Algoriphagus faecimaris]